MIPLDILQELDNKTTELVKSIILTMPEELKECAKDNESLRALVTMGVAVNLTKAFLKKWGEIDSEKK